MPLNAQSIGVDEPDYYDHMSNCVNHDCVNHDDYDDEESEEDKEGDLKEGDYDKCASANSLK